MTIFSDGRALAIVNPAAGARRDRRWIEALARAFRELGAHVDMTRTPGPGEATRIAREAIEEGYRRLIAVGGDGTVHEVVNGMLGSEAELAIIPAGSANDLAGGLGIRGWRAAARLAVTGKARRVDLAMANGRAFANCVGVGADAAGARTVARHKRLLGPAAYLTAALQTVATYRPRPVRVHIDGEVIVGRQLLVVASNGGWFGNGMRIAPSAVVDDGLLDLCIVGDTSRLETLALLARVYRGTHVGRPKVRTERVRELVIEQEPGQPVQLDGELARGERIEVRCMPAALSIVTP